MVLENKLKIACGRMGNEIVKEFGMNMYVPAVFKMDKQQGPIV